MKSRSGTTRFLYTMCSITASRGNDFPNLAVVLQPCEGWEPSQGSRLRASVHRFFQLAHLIAQFGGALELQVLRGIPHFRPKFFEQVLLLIDCHILHDRFGDERRPLALEPYIPTSPNIGDGSGRHDFL